MVPEEERKKRVKDFIKRFGWKGPVFEISALTREGCGELVTEIYDYIWSSARLNIVPKKRPR